MVFFWLCPPSFAPSYILWEYITILSAGAFVAAPVPGIINVLIKTILLVELPQVMHHWQFQP